MQKLLGTEYEDFLESYDNETCRALKINTLKISKSDFLEISPYLTNQVAWEENGLYYDNLNGTPDSVQAQAPAPGKHPYYKAGLYYIQEPSAMLPAALLKPLPGEKVLDMCAAPGGKTAQLTASLKEDGLLFANDINSDRIKALVRNIEMLGVRNAIILNEDPQRLVKMFPQYFDKILVDAPCSGEGMFRRDPSSIAYWEAYKPARCSELQKKLLNFAKDLLKPSGKIVYSTCTFSPDENENVIVDFIRDNPEFQLENIEMKGGMLPGKWNGEDLKGTVRIWPHKAKGDGHFAALLVRNCIADRNLSWEEDVSGDSDNLQKSDSLQNFDHLQKFGYSQKLDNLQKLDGTQKLDGSQKFDGLQSQVEYNSIYMKLLWKFIKNALTDNCIEMIMKGFIFNIGDGIYRLPQKFPSLDGLKVVKFGWYLGSIDRKKSIFEPSQSLVTALSKNDFIRTVNLNAGSMDATRYLKGETLILENTPDGISAVCLDGYTCGWGMARDNIMKNLYPKGWRQLG